MKKLIVLTSVLVGIVSCKQDKPVPPCVTDAASIAKVYKITAYTYKASATSPEIDYYSVLFPDACDRDNIMTFNINGTYHVTDVGSVCSPAGSDDGTWSLVGNTMQTDIGALTIESFDCKKLVLGFTGLNVLGDKLKITYVAQ